MSITETISRPTHRSLMNKSKDDLASLVMQLMDAEEIDRRHAEQWRSLTGNHWKTARMLIDKMNEYGHLPGSFVDECESVLSVIAGVQNTQEQQK